MYLHGEGDLETRHSSSRRRWSKLLQRVPTLLSTRGQVRAAIGRQPIYSSPTTKKGSQTITSHYKELPLDRPSYPHLCPPPPSDVRPRHPPLTGPTPVDLSLTKNHGPDESGDRVGDDKRLETRKGMERNKDKRKICDRINL